MKPPPGRPPRDGSGLNADSLAPRTGAASTSARGEEDTAVQGTNDDATVSKLSCVQLGYWEDPFVSYFVRQPARRPPLINRGYYARLAAIRQLLLQFLLAGGSPDSAPPHKQVLSLGAGYDTTFFQLAASGVTAARYAELDFSEVAQRKAAVMSRHAALREQLGEGASVDASKGCVSSSRYSLQPADLRSPASVEAAVAAAGVDRSLPTFILLECVLVYMQAEEASQLLAWAARSFPSAAVLVYDPTRPHDPFGLQMQKNLRARGCPFLSIASVADPEAHAHRLLACGWGRAEAADMRSVYRRLLEPRGRAQAERAEMLDEVEEWHLMLAHYALALGVNDQEGVLAALSLGAAAADEHGA